MRDNLIRREGEFDTLDFVNDLFGEVCGGDYHMQMRSSVELENADDDEITAKRRGLIVWGEPWDVERWEVTPGFVGKWRWVLKGCEELIAGSNKWRAKRDEGPLLFDRVVDDI